MKTKPFFISLLIGLLGPLFFAPVSRAAFKLELVTTFDYPDSNVTFTIPSGINAAGDIVGYTSDNAGVYRGFVRYADGTFSAPIIAPNEDNFTIARGISSDGTICGFYQDASNLRHGFILSGGTFTQFDVPNANQTELTGINDAGDLIGTYYLGSTEIPFIDIGGTIQDIRVRQYHNEIYPGGINNAGEFVGSYLNPNRTAAYGFIGINGGRVKAPISAPGAPQTYLDGLNDNGIFVGSASVANDGYGEGMAFQFPGSFAFFAFPHTVLTTLTGVNNNGLICGHVKDNIPHIHGLILQATVEAKP